MYSINESFVKEIVLVVKRICVSGATVMYLSCYKQIVVSLGSGPWDQLFGGGNSPAFAVAAVAALVSGLIAVLAIPRSGPQKARSHV